MPEKASAPVILTMLFRLKNLWSLLISKYVSTRNKPSLSFILGTLEAQVRLYCRWHVDCMLVPNVACVQRAGRLKEQNVYLVRGKGTMLHSMRHNYELALRDFGLALDSRGSVAIVHTKRAV